jgi:hypothetical protein
VAISRENWPDWWEWELDCANPHLAKRMLDRSFNETDLRDMLEHAKSYRPDVEPGRWIIVTSHRSQPWEVIVEPDPITRVLIVITAYNIA